MNQASLYQHANEVQRYDASRVLKEYASVIQWREDGCDSLIDIGCGSGNVLMDFVYPLMPAKFELITGVDISENMVNFASKHYEAYDRVKFSVLDISENQLPEEFCDQYDHITSFYCLHWIHDQKKALQNMYKMLRSEGGDCLLVFLATNLIYNVYEALAKNPKWSPYMQDLHKFLSPQHHSKDPGGEFKQLLQQAGFVDIKVEVRNEVFTYVGETSIRNNVRAICPFLERMTRKEREDYLNDLSAVFKSFQLREVSENPDETKVIVPYKLMVVYAKRLGTFADNLNVKPTLKGLD